MNLETISRRRFVHIVGTSLWLSACNPSSSRNEEVVEKEEVVYTPQGRWVVLVHGIRGSPNSMSDLEKALKDKGYNVLNWSYPSTDYPIQKSADVLSKAVVDTITHTGGVDSVDIVAHSIGGL